MVDVKTMSKPVEIVKKMNPGSMIYNTFPQPVVPWKHTSIKFLKVHEIPKTTYNGYK